jgi:hypothetical protein
MISVAFTSPSLRAGRHTTPCALTCLLQNVDRHRLLRKIVQEMQDRRCITGLRGGAQLPHTVADAKDSICIVRCIAALTAA